jgi:hypothetical protein
LVQIADSGNYGSVDGWVQNDRNDRRIIPGHPLETGAAVFPNPDVVASFVRPVRGSAERIGEETTARHAKVRTLDRYRVSRHPLQAKSL